MLNKYKGIIFKCIPYSETSLVLDIYTESAGLNSYIISGIRKKKSKYISLYKPMNLISFVAYSGDKQKLYRIKEASYLHMYTEIPKSVVRSTIAMFMIDLLRNSIYESEANFPLFEFIFKSLVTLDSKETISNIYHHHFAMELTKYLGFYPGNNWSEEKYIFHMEDGRFMSNSLSGHNELRDEMSRYLGQLLQQGTQAIIPKEDRSILLDKILTYYKLHVTSFKNLQSLEICKTIFS